MRSKIRESFLTFSTILITFLSGGGMASAIEAPVTLSSNSDSPQTITIQRSLTGLKNQVTNTFTYGIEEASDNPATVTGLPDDIYVRFDHAFAFDGYAAANNYLDLSGVGFTEVGDYTFILSETGSTNASAYPIDSTKYHIYVSVRNELDANGAPTGKLIPTLSLQAKKNGTGDKGDVLFTSEAVLTYAKITKNVEGNLARRDQYFKFRVTVDGASDGDVFTISGQDESIEYNGETIQTLSQFTVGNDNYIYLRHGQTALIGANGDEMEIPVGATFTVVEDLYDGYTAWINDVETNTNNGTVLETANISTPESLSDNNQVNFVNKKEASVLTGIVTKGWPFMVLAGICIAGIFAIHKVTSAKVNEN